VLDQEPGARAGFLDRVCALAPEKRQRLETLLARQEQAGSFLEGAAAIEGTVAGADWPNGATQPTEAADQVLAGRYNLLEQIGEGGMGTVWLAMQTEPVRRSVAVKLVKAGMDSRTVLSRFEAERQALALMDHPNIAKVLDGGSTEQGRPFLVMEYVKGVPITQYCDDARLTVAERLELFVMICKAVQHAHQKGLIHRDLKPTNLLICLHDDKPTPKVIDFGLAKTLHQPLTDHTLCTAHGLMLGTPLYMSPEQAAVNNLDVDSRSDIYALGVVLYELLTGTTPLEKEQLKQASWPEIMRLIKETEPPKPSTRLSGGASGEWRGAKKDKRPFFSGHSRLTPRHFQELDWIAMKALDKDPNRRYETASAFAADVQRYLRDEPVAAGPPSVWYRFGKFARRNRGALTMAGVVTAASVIALAAVAGSVGWIVSVQAAREAAMDGEVTRAVDEARNLINDAKWPEALARVRRAREVTVAAGRQQLPERLEEIQRDLSMAQRLEEIYSQPKSHDDFTGQEQDLRYAHAFKDYGIDVALLPAAEAAERIKARCIRSQLVLALDLWSNMRNRAGTPMADWQRLLEIAQAADNDHWRRALRGARQRGDRQAVAALAASADLLRMPPASFYLLGRTCTNFLNDPEQAMAVYRQAQRRYPADLWLNETLALTSLRTRPPRYDEAIRFYSVALTLRPSNPYLTYVLGKALLDKGSYPEAIAELSRAIALEPDYLDALWSRGDAYLKTGAGDRAFADFSRLVELQPKSALAWQFRGVARGHLGQWDMAIADYAQAIDLDPKDASSWRNRGRVHARLHERDRALADFSAALELDPKSALTWLQRGEVFVAMRQWPKAVADLDKLLDLDPRDPIFWFQNACLRLEIGDREGYRSLCSRMLERFGQSKKMAEVGILAHACALAPQALAGDARVRQLAQLRMDLTPSQPAARAWSIHVLGLAHYRTGQNDRAIELLQEGVRDTPDSDRNVLNFLVLAMAHHRLMHTAEAQRWLSRAQKCIKQEIRPGPDDGFIPPRRPWWDWLCVQMLEREAEQLLNAPDRGAPDEKEPEKPISKTVSR
jgi:tetratricopeptide (TPR) repeat protein